MSFIAISDSPEGGTTQSIDPSTLAVADPPAVVVRNAPRAQIFLCKGCCCGQTERQRPPVPVEEFKAIWKAEKLNRSVQLTVSGCLGPCQLANVVLVMTPGRAEWLGRLRDNGQYGAIIGWARECHAERTIAPLPAILRELAFQRFEQEGTT